MKKFIFEIHIEGLGETEEDAWSNALLEFSPGNRDYDESKEICIDCNEEECECPEDIKCSTGFLGDNWLEKADDDYERNRDG